MPETIHSCQIHKKYSWIVCQNSALSGDPDGLCILHSQDKGKNPDDFKAALQARWQQADQQSYDFRGVFFPGYFDPNEVFKSREFNKPVDFFWATFTELAYFSQASFTEEANFSEARFMEWARFSEASFTKEANFSKARFTERANFPLARFTEGVNFSEAAIGGRVVFREINPRDEAGRAPPFIGDFSGLEFQDRAVPRFQDTSLAQIRFEGTDLRRLELHHVTWGSLGGRQIIHAEVNLREDEKEDPWFEKWFRSQVLPWLGFYAPYEPPPETPWGDRYGEVERLYRYLKINFETEQDYKNAGDFHYGEMEMHRRASKWRWFPFYWYNFYWFLSGYGERPSWALGWLAGFLLTLPLLVLGFGLDSVAGGTTPGFLETLAYIFEKATFQRPLPLSNLNFLGSFISNLSLLIIPGQAALFLLALRNRLGRRR